MASSSACCDFAVSASIWNQLRRRRFANRLRASTAGLDAVVDVRGIGLMIGLELRDKAVAARVQERCLTEGLVVLTCGPAENVLRLVPPLTLTDDELDLGLTIVESALASDSA